MVCLRLSIALVLLFSVDAVFFRTRIYTPWLEPDSSAGLFEMILRRELEFQKRAGDNVVITLGDSRFAYLPKIANQMTAASGLVFRSAGVAGSDPRSWYYMLRDLDPASSRYRAIVFGVNDYQDEDVGIDHADDIRALHYAIVRLRLTDFADFPLSYLSWQRRWEAFRGVLFKGFVLQHDVQAFLSAPGKRIDYVRLCQRGFESWTNDYEGPQTTMTGLSIDWNTLAVHLPPGADRNQRDTVAGYLARPPFPQTGREAQFRRQWFGRILERYRHSRTRIIFIRLPRGPLVRPGTLVHKLSASIREFGRRPGVALVDEDAFDSLETPALFKDGMHLNRPGSVRFSRMLVDAVAAKLRGV